MAGQSIKDNFLYSCTFEKKRGNEQFVPEHAFGYIVSGEAHFYSNENTVVCKTGMTGLVKRNQLLKTVKLPSSFGPFKSINIILDKEFLRRYAAENNIQQGHYTGEPLLEIAPDAFIKSYFDSLLPYFDEPARMTEAIAKLKLYEAIELLMRCNKQVKELLFDLSEPFKINLDAYMNQHYMYNVSLAQFAKLTGRSLATFKRDFHKTFELPPEKWLQKKRLEHAHYLLLQKHSASDVYLEVGFENLSHFSTAFKKFYGYTPSSLR